MFASLDQLNFLSTSRRDDMIAMCYLVIYMLNEAYLPGVSNTNEYDQNQRFVEVRNAKNMYSIESLCQGTAQSMRDIIKEVFSLGFKDKPNYNLVKEMFQQKIEDIKLRPESELISPNQ